MYGDLLASERAALHGALARTLVRRPELAAAGVGVAGELAHHWYSAGELVAALETSVQASADAERAFAWAETQRHSERALELWYRVPNPERVTGIDRVALLERAAVAAVRAERPQRGAELASRAVAELDPEREPLRLAYAYTILGRCRWLSAETAGALEAYGEAVSLVPAQPPSSERALVLATEAQALMLIGQSHSALARCEEALALADSLGDGLIQAHVHNTLCRAFAWMAGDPIEHAAIARRIARSRSAPSTRSAAHTSTARRRWSSPGEPRTPRSSRRRGSTFPRAGGWPTTRCTSPIRSPAGSCGSASSTRWRGDGPRPSLAAARWRRPGTRLRDCWRPPAETSRPPTPSWSSAEQLARGVGGPEWWPGTMAAIAVLRLWQGRLDDAVRTVGEALASIDQQQYAPWLVDFSSVYPTAARVQADRADRARARGDAGVAGDAEAAAGRALSQLDDMLAAIPGRASPATRRRRSSADCRRVGAPPPGAAIPAPGDQAADGYAALM